MPKKLTKEEIVQRIKTINPNVEIIGEYVNTNTKIKCRCLIDGYVWDAYFYNLSKGSGCPMCAGKMQKTTEQYIQEIVDNNLQVECCGKYINEKTKILHRCLIHNVYWLITPSHILRGQGCHLCRSEKISKARLKDEKLYIQQLKKYNPSILLCGKYTGTHNKVLHKCNVCNTMWEVEPASLINPNGGNKSSCPNCQLSKLANRIKYYLDINNLNYKQEYTFADCKYKGFLRFDFAVFNHNNLLCLIEADGVQHYKPIQFGGCSLEQAQYNFIEQNKKDNIKNKYCKDNKIKLLHIPYWEIDNIEEILNKELKGGDLNG